MRSEDFTTCAYCPRLCRHVCPVAVATGLESATPTAMMTAPLLVERGALDVAEGLMATAACLGCGACTAHCKVHVPVPERLAEWRSAHGAPDGAPVTAGWGALRGGEPPRPVETEGPVRFVTCFEGPHASPDQLACCGRRDGFPERAEELARAVAEENVRLFSGRSVACADEGCAQWLARHGARVVAEPGNASGGASDGA